MDARAQEIINQIASLTGDFGVNVTINRVVQAATPIRDVFGNPTNATVSTFTAKVIIESQKIDTTPTLAGGKAKEVLKLIDNPGVIVNNDEIMYGGHTYKVTFAQPVPFAGSDVVNFVHAEREVD